MFEFSILLLISNESVHKLREINESFWKTNQQNENLILRTKLKDLELTVEKLKEKLGYFEKNSEQKNINEISEERDFFLKIFDSFQDGVYIVDENENIKYVNPILEKEFGNWKGKKCYAYFHDGKKRCSFCKIDNVFLGEVVQWEWHSKKANRSGRPFSTQNKRPPARTGGLEER